jgi:hypothetical protein
LKLHSLITVGIILAALLGSVSLAVQASGSVSPQDSISFTVTTTTNYQATTGGNLQVNFNSVDLTQPPPQTYSFGVTAKTTPGYWITRIFWQFGDGAVLDVPYCCQSQISEVQNHAYAQPGTYTVLVVAYDNAGNFGNAYVTVNWSTPIPEYPSYALPLVLSMLLVLVGAASVKMKRNASPIFLR